MLEVDKLSCSRNDKKLFSDLTFLLRPGMLIQLHGSNGVGKTTLLRCLAGLIPSSAGNVKYSGSILYVGHSSSLHPSLTIIENLQFLQSLNEDNNHVDYFAALDFVGLSKKSHSLCAELSAGQLQRIQLARLFLSTAQLWLLDEPGVNLDATAQTVFQDLCAAKVAAGGMIVLATHNKDLFADKIINLAEYA